MTRVSDGRLVRGEASKKAILSAATRVVAGSGVSALTHRTVAEQARVSHSLVTYHFSSAADLRRAVFTHAGDRLATALERLIAERPSPHDVPQVAATLAVSMVGDLRDENITCYEMVLAAIRDPGLRPTARAFGRRLAVLLEPQAQGQERASAASSAVLGYIMTAMALGEDADLATFRDGVVRFVEHFDPER
jgi:DNA-binding transcriptional regulator YbjK